MFGLVPRSWLSSLIMQELQLIFKVANNLLSLVPPSESRRGV